MAVEILNICNDFQQKILDISEMCCGRIRFGMARYVSAMLLPGILLEFFRAYPKIEACVEEENSSLLEMQTAAGKLDFAVIHGAELTAGRVVKNVCYQMLARDDFCVVINCGAESPHKGVRMSGYSYPVLDVKYLENMPLVLENRKYRMRW